MTYSQRRIACLVPFRGRPLASGACLQPRKTRDGQRLKLLASVINGNMDAGGLRRRGC